jgi:hypothetical protein
MENPQTFKLIEGSYSSIESREILQGVFSRKIQFHQMKNFSSQERFGKDDQTALKRIPELKESIDKILRMIESSQQEGEQFESHSEIVIRLVKPTRDV